MEQFNSLTAEARTARPEKRGEHATPGASILGAARMLSPTCFGHFRAEKGLAHLHGKKE